MPLADEHTGVVDGFRQSQLEHLRLQAALEEIVHFQRQDVVQVLLGGIEQTETGQPTQQRGALEQPSLSILLEGEQLARRRADLGQGVLHPPHLALVAQAVLAAQL
eukprot:ctg_2642.g452